MPRQGGGARRPASLRRSGQLVLVERHGDEITLISVDSSTNQRETEGDWICGNCSHPNLPTAGLCEACQQQRT
jgi:hypothetical protein